MCTDVMDVTRDEAKRILRRLGKLINPLLPNARQCYLSNSKRDPFGVKGLHVNNYLA